MRLQLLSVGRWEGRRQSPPPDPVSWSSPAATAGFSISNILLLKIIAYYLLTNNNLNFFLSFLSKVTFEKELKESSILVK